MVIKYLIKGVCVGGGGNRWKYYIDRKEGGGQGAGGLKNEKNAG